MSSLNQIRSSFLNFFKENGHEIVPSSPLVPRNDPTLMFTAAGMVQFKNVFTGAEIRPYRRATTAQKCVRAGGKHNDLDNVGYTARHHTFFEMLGNFSFGDYFKDEAIEFAWNMITKEYGIDKNRLCVTIYHDDDHAFSVWKKLTGFSDDRIIRIATSDNFWSAGDTGPCGPCTEIFYDHGSHIAGGPPGSMDADGDRFIEIWNLVFMQYDQLPGGERVLLPKPSIDTGMGLERLAALLQGKHDNYDIDLFRALIEASAHASNTDADGAGKISHRVIADHLRSGAFLIADGVLPNNEGRGYVLRRILRRAMRHAQLLGCKEPLLHRLVPALVAQMGDAYPELKRAEPLIRETLLLEETRFRQTLERGLKLLDDELVNLPAGKDFSGETAFKLYDTYGFPLDLTEDALRSKNISVDRAGFDAAMAAQKALARKAWVGSGDSATETVWFELGDRLGASEFLGYAVESAEGMVTAILKEGVAVTSVTVGDKVQIITNQTPFYGESGGQIGDSGMIETASCRILVHDTQKKAGGLIVHIGTVETGRLQLGDAVRLAIDSSKRQAIRANHSATHLLHAALRKHLGEHVTQKGSMVAADRLRFDFSHPKGLSAEERHVLETEINQRIWANSVVTTRLMAVDKAIEAGAMALFGEKYDEEVRVLSMGGLNEGDADWSIELCGGTHVNRTGDIGLFRIISETAVASGVRRIEAVTAKGAFEWLTERDAVLNSLAGNLKSSVEELPGRVNGLSEANRKLAKEVSELKRKLATGNAGGEDTTKQIGAIRYNAKIVEGIEAKDLKPLVEDLKKQLGSGVVALVAVNDGKASVVVAVTPDHTAKISAVDLVRIAASTLGGSGGGGRPDMAQAGGPDGDKAQMALDAVEQHLTNVA